MSWIIPLSRRILSVFLSMVLLTYLLFLILDSAPGNYLELKRSSFPISQEGNEAYQKWENEFKKEHPFGAPTIARTQVYLLGLIKGDVGYSYQDPDQLITSIVQDKLKVSIILILIAFIIALIGAILIGLIAAKYKNQWWDFFLMGGSTLGLALPPYVAAVLFVLFFSIFCRKFMIGDVFPLSWLALPSGGWGQLRHIILPALVLSLAPMASISRYVRSFVLDILDEPYLLSARAKGITRRRFYIQHILKPTLAKLCSILGVQLSLILMGLIFVEQIFRIPGIGQLFIQAASLRDTPLIITITLTLVLLVMLFHIILDLILIKLDPRVRLES